MTRSHRSREARPVLSGYGRLPIAEKRADAIGRMREPAVTCPSCDIQVMPADLLAHVEQRCDGPREPVASSRWLSGREARELGVPQQTLSFWARTGLVRCMGGPMDRRYLLRDLALKIAQRRGFHRR